MSLIVLTLLVVWQDRGVNQANAKGFEAKA